MRKILRYYARIAHKDHGLCYNCDLPIMAGDPYRAEVTVIGKWFKVFKFHIDCPCDPNYDYEKDRHDDRKLSFDLAA